MGLMAASKRLIIIGLIIVAVLSITALIFGKMEAKDAMLLIIPIITGFFGLLKSDD